jgi:hypothetical protein
MLCEISFAAERYFRYQVFAISSFNFGELPCQNYVDLAGFSDQRTVPKAKFSSQTVPLTITFSVSLCHDAY